VRIEGAGGWVDPACRRERCSRERWKGRDGDCPREQDQEVGAIVAGTQLVDKWSEDMVWDWGIRNERVYDGGC
jgi:hypothetical protein